MPLALCVLALAATGCSAGFETEKGHQVGAFQGVLKMPAELADRPAPRIVLQDADRRRFDSATLKGDAYAVTFAYANCPPICQLLADEVREALAWLSPTDRRRFQVLAISVDPHGDSTAAVRAFLDRHRESANYHYLLGSGEELQPIWDAYHSAPQIPADPQTARLTGIWLVGRSGRVRALFDASSPFKAELLADDFRQLLREERASP